jgi:pimeloyl-ACP methyl ester carboxylesterase
MSVTSRCHLLLAAAVAFAGLAPARADDAKAVPFSVKVVGKGKPMILIPGLACAGAVWDGTVDHFKDHYECHVLTLAGFAGQPPVEGPFLETVRKAVVDYIRAKKLDKPVIVGHSLGGFLVYRLGETEPDLVGPLVAVDGLPCMLAVFTPTDPSPQMLKQTGDAAQARMAKASREDYLKNQGAMMKAWLDGSKYQDTVTKWGADSDQATVAKAMGELLSFDARTDIGRIHTPVLHLAAIDKRAVGAGVSRDTITKRMEAQLTKIPVHELAVAEGSRHFIMYDAPEWMWKKMDEFLAKK